MNISRNNNSYQPRFLWPSSWFHLWEIDLQEQPQLPALLSVGVSLSVCHCVTVSLFLSRVHNNEDQDWHCSEFGRQLNILVLYNNVPGIIIIIVVLCKFFNILLLLLDLGPFFLFFFTPPISSSVTTTRELLLIIFLCPSNNPIIFSFFTTIVGLTTPPATTMCICRISASSLLPNNRSPRLYNNRCQKKSSATDDNGGAFVSFLIQQILQQHEIHLSCGRHLRQEM